MTSDSSPMRNRTEVRRRCSSSIVPASLKSGTTTDTCGRPDRLRDMTKAPSGGMGEVVAYQLDALAGDDRARFHAAEQLELLRARFEQARARPLQRLVEVPGMNHQLRDARPRRAAAREADRNRARPCEYARRDAACGVPATPRCGHFVGPTATSRRSARLAGPQLARMERGRPECGTERRGERRSRTRADTRGRACVRRDASA